MSEDPTQVDDWISSSFICSELREHFDGRVPKKRKVIELASDGTVPLSRPGYEWGCRRSQLPAVAAALGLRPKGARRSSKAAAEAPIAA